jgi:hypothetical protein
LIITPEEGGLAGPFTSLVTALAVGAADGTVIDLETA